MILIGRSLPRRLAVTSGGVGMTDRYLLPFSCPSMHAASAEIIRNRSSNLTDIREIAVAGLDLGNVRSVLDLGCGFGFMAETIAPLVHQNAFVVGIDACEENGPAFLQVLKNRKREGEFVQSKLGSTLPFRDHRFDLVVSTYSLYFFVETIPEIARVLSPTGLFLVITHSRNSFTSLVTAAGLELAQAPIMALIERFSAENGHRHLSPHFAEVERISYPNRLCFHRDHLDELLQYVRFKLPILLPSLHRISQIPKEITRRLIETTSQPEGLTVEKDDAIFRCWSPQCP